MGFVGQVTCDRLLLIGLPQPLTTQQRRLTTAAQLSKVPYKGRTLLDPQNG